MVKFSYGVQCRRNQDRKMYFSFAITIDFILQNANYLIIHHFTTIRNSGEKKRKKPYSIEHTVCDILLYTFVLMFFEFFFTIQNVIEKIMRKTLLLLLHQASSLYELRW